MDYDVVIAGGGPAGLGAALALGRARKRVLLCDAGSPRNALAEGVHNFVTRDGIAPRDFRAAARRDLEAYASVEIRDVRVRDVAREGAGLTVSLEDGAIVGARRVLVASGVVDIPPDVKGMREVWGRRAYQCPYCHGWEVRDRPWAVLVSNDAAVEWALLLRGWTSSLTVLTGGAPLAPESIARFARVGLRVRTGRLEAIREDAENLHVSLEGDAQDAVICAALFLRPTQEPAPLVKKLNLALDGAGPWARVDPKTLESSMPGVHVAGDASSMMQAAIAAAAAGTMAGAMMNHLLTLEGT